MSVAESFTSHNLNPHYFTKDRCEFRLNNTFGDLLRTDLRIEGIEINASAASSQFPLGVGALSLIRNARLLNDNVEITAMTGGANRWLGQKNLMFNNEAQLGKKLPIESQRTGLHVNELFGDQPRLQPLDAYTQVDTAGTNNNSYTIQLNQIFPILDQLPYLDMRVFDKLRVVIEWEPSPFAVKATTKTFNGEPFLRFYSYNQDLKNVKRDYEVDFVNYVHEIVQIDAIGDDEIQEDDIRLKIFDNKFVNRLMIIGESQTSTTNSNFGRHHSYYFPEGEYSVRLNGKEIRPQGGLKSRMSMLANAVDVLGDYQTTLGQVVETMRDDNNSASENFNVGIANGGYTGYTGFLIGGVVNTLDVKFARASRATGNNYVNNYDKMAVNLRFIGEVVKKMKVMGGQFVIMDA